MIQSGTPPKIPTLERARRRLVDICVDLDPGGLKLSLALKTGLTIFLCFVLTLMMTRAIPHVAVPRPTGLPDGLAPLAARMTAAFEAARTVEGFGRTFPVMSAILGANFFMMLPQDRYRVELWWFFRVALAILLGFVLIGLAGPGSWGMGDVPMAILWVLLITFGIFMRAWGPEMRKLGMLLGLTGLTFALFNPTRDEGFWYPAVALIVIVVVFAVRFLTIRPSLVLAYESQCQRFQQVTAAELTRYRLVQPLPRDRNGNPDDLLRQRWTILQKFAPGAIKERPDLASRFDAKLIAAYRISVAAMALREAYVDMNAAEKDTLFRDTRLQSVLDRLAGRLGELHAAAFPSERVSNPELDDILNGLIEPDKAVTAGNVQEMRFIHGLIRLEGALNDFLEARLSIDVVQPVPASPAAGEGTKARTMSPAVRSALQALVACSITTALQFTFDLNHAYWATLTVLVVLNGGAGQTLIRTLQRFLGTVAGVIAAIVVVPLVGANTPLALALMVLVLPFVMLTLETRYTIAAGGIGFLVGMMLHITVDAGAATLLARAYETGIGAGIALVISLVLFPSYTGHQAAPRLAALVARARDALARMEHEDRVYLTNSLLGDLQTLQADTPAIIAERRMFGHSGRNFEAFVFLLNAFVVYLGQYEVSRRDLGRAVLPEQAKSLVDDLQTGLLAALDQLEKILRDDSAVSDAPAFERRLTTRDATLLPAGLMTSRHDLVAVVILLMAGNRLGANVNDLSTVARRM
ncbi:FUSC family protein [Chachezhania antarctica]|uniref:FUSC family protein n=1 Tax=Chachezhania antarctica TaxID=2340860 RepID=UPI0013CEEACB|nr:FUSC family protein [Chachezhania antarctica]